jgi:hypothetical protein
MADSVEVIVNKAVGVEPLNLLVEYTPPAAPGGQATVESTFAAPFGRFVTFDERFASRELTLPGPRLEGQEYRPIKEIK